MPRYVDGSTQRLAQLTGDYNPVMLRPERENAVSAM